MNYFNYLYRQGEKEGNGEACLLSVMQYHGREQSMEELTHLTGSTAMERATLVGLQKAAQACGFSADCIQSDVDSLIRLNEPAILHVVAPESLQYYYLIYFAFENEGCVMGNTITGSVEYLSSRQLSYIWVTKRCLIVKPTKNR